VCSSMGGMPVSARLSLTRCSAATDCTSSPSTAPLSPRLHHEWFCLQEDHVHCHLFHPVVWVAVKTGWHLTEGAVGEGFKWALFVLLAAGTVFVGPFGIAVPFQRRLKEKTGEVGEGEREVELARLLEILEADIPLQVSHVMSQRPDNLPRS